MSIKERICVKLNVRNGSEALDKALAEHLDHTNVRSAAAYLIGPAHHAHRSPPAGSAPNTLYLPKNELLIVYSVDGVVDPSTGDAEIFVLDRTTMERHRQHAAAKKPIHYVALFGSAAIAPADFSKVSSEIPFPGEHVDVVAGVNWDEPSPVCFVSYDATPSTAVMATSTLANQIITRSSYSLSEAIAAAEAAERGVANIDHETAMTHCCAWLAETIELVEQQFTASETSADSALAVVEAFLQRNTSLQKTREFIATDPNVFTRIERALHSSSAARQRWTQKKAGLDCLAESTRLSATWVALLSSHAMSLKIRNPSSTQSLEPTNATMASIADALRIILATFPGQNVTESDQFTHYIHERLVPLITSDLVSQVEKLLNLASVFNVGHETIPKMPTCVSEGVQSHLIASSWSLRSWLYSWHHTCAMLNHTHPARLSESAVDSAQAAAYASERCEDLRDMLRHVNRASLGIMSTEVAVLYTVMDRAANAFGLLRAEELSNWEKFAAVFNKTLALKLDHVESVEYSPAVVGRLSTHSSPLSPFTPLLSQTSVTNLNNNNSTNAASLTQSAYMNYSRSIVNTSMMSNIANASAIVEEREVLSSRVTVMSQELAEARLLIASLQGQLQRANAALATAQELNVYMMAELRKAQLGEAGADLPQPVGKRESLVERLAREEHARRESGRQIEDEELESP